MTGVSSAITLDVTWTPISSDFVAVDAVKLSDGISFKVKETWGDLLERFWICSTGVGVYVDDSVPLHRPSKWTIINNFYSKRTTTTLSTKTSVSSNLSLDTQWAWQTSRSSGFLCIASSMSYRMECRMKECSSPQSGRSGPSTKLI